MTPIKCLRTSAVLQCVHCWQTSVLMPLFCVQHANFMIYLETNQRGVAIIIIFSSLVALAYNVTHNYLLQRTSAVTVTVLGEVKIVGLLLLSAMLLPGEPVMSSRLHGIRAGIHEIVYTCVSCTWGVMLAEMGHAPAGESSQFTLKMTVGCVLAVAGLLL